ncbi:bifunctional UDP-N-acetylglucosamine diphosphorylase/glucosamine-1-phosphate N-acetyltransferase GlmU [Candidatus Liberibacter sp.]|uniref:bifunctional UDP-N-acetylglucosamine diphosphorylase/glucosamine-1-phosphate N-acetyltransferase GlmU n=1 Tax=Candidatus Liberibacter sp. TaxID=34022 RepID=UPI0015F5C4C4|nr:bifunctional UDP-N-acetylglucosamine diphosphorylase/glucosamine-1-phosphate N-acetyltransferase GlmU [Candidatus Liberibacter sp.]
MKRKCLAIVLAAGNGRRMNSSFSKVLHKVAGKPMITHVMETIAMADISDVALVLGDYVESVMCAARKKELSIECFTQDIRQGTAHAVLSAKSAIERGYDDVIVMYGDVPLISSRTLQKALDKITEGFSISVIGFKTDNPQNYGRLLTEGDELISIREEKDASDEEKKIRYCNSGLMAINGLHILDWLSKIKKNDKTQEYYLTDIIEIARSCGGSVTSIEVEEEEVSGCNNRYELSIIENTWQSHCRRKMLLSGVTMVVPETVFLSHDTCIEPDTVIEPHVVFGCGVTVERSVRIRSFSYLEGVHISAGALIGPFARLREGSKIGQNARIGNFCEIKKTIVGEGSKINHLSYLGDSSIGTNVNIGAGSITCNYDGLHKYQTIIGDESFIGSNSSLVAPISIGSGSYIASGSVVTENTPKDSLVFGRARQVTKEKKISPIQGKKS